jgi:hypothetical protein
MILIYSSIFIYIFTFLYFNNNLISDKHSIINKFLILLAILLYNILYLLLLDIKNKNKINTINILKNSINNSVLCTFSYIILIDLLQYDIFNNINNIVKIIIFSLIISIINILSKNYK